MKKWRRALQPSTLYRPMSPRDGASDPPRELGSFSKRSLQHAHSLRLTPRSENDTSCRKLSTPDSTTTKRLRVCLGVHVRRDQTCQTDWSAMECISVQTINKTSFPSICLDCYFTLDESTFDLVVRVLYHMVRMVHRAGPKKGMHYREPAMSSLRQSVPIQAGSRGVKDKIREAKPPRTSLGLERIRGDRPRCDSPRGSLRQFRLVARTYGAAQINLTCKQLQRDAPTVASVCSL